MDDLAAKIAGLFASKPMTPERKAARAAQDAKWAEMMPNWPAAALGGYPSMSPDDAMAVMGSTNAVGGGMKAVLAMDEASRMARAKEMFPVEAYTGANRLDRLLEKPGLDPKRATSGPMPFFTDSTDLASSYAKGKADTSMVSENYGDWFKFKPQGARTEKNIDQAWSYLSQAEKQRLTNELSQIGYIDEAYTKIGKTTDNVGGAGRDHWDYTLKQHKGNALAAAKDLWLDSGNLFGQEEKFLDVLKNVGIGDVRYNSPNLEFPGVLPARLNIKKPFETTADNIGSVLDDLETASKRKRAIPGGADQWDKRSVSGADWMERLRGDINNGTTHAWTSIPDWVTEVLKKRGFDGIKDVGGKNGGPAHTVWIPFEPNQVRSRFAKFDPAKIDSPDLLAGVAAAPLALGDEQKEKVNQLLNRLGNSDKNRAGNK